MLPATDSASAIPACGSKTEPQAAAKPSNSNVSRILPVTTFRTIDLGGRKISDRLFSIFCGKMRVFLFDSGAQVAGRLKGAPNRQHAEKKRPQQVSRFPSRARNGLRMPRNQDNSNVSKILPLTTFRTIDLGGRKISGPLFSIFWAETRVFFEVFSAPVYVRVLRAAGFEEAQFQRRQEIKLGNFPGEDRLTLFSPALHPVPRSRYAVPQ